MKSAQEEEEEDENISMADYSVRRAAWSVIATMFVFMLVVFILL